VKTVYFDNAATSWPKPESMMKAMMDFNAGIGGSPGRSAHRMSLDSGRIIYDAREKMASLLGSDDPFQVVFTKNATEALNIAISGLLKPGDHCITSSMEHNSVMRPLRALELSGIKLDVVNCSSSGGLDPAHVERAIKADTRAIYLTHASNVTGTIMPVAEVGRIAKSCGIIFCVDAAQTAGTVPIDVTGMGIDILAFTGHKSLFGPQGTGGLYIRKSLEQVISPIMFGGTGSRSEYEQQPDFMPDRFEAGTPNTIGIAGLSAGIEFIEKTGIDVIREKEKHLASHFIDELKKIKGATVYGTRALSDRIAVVSFNLGSLSPSEASLILDEKYSIMNRPGLHCAPQAHRTIGTFPTGTLRFSFGYFNTEDEVEYGLKVLYEISRRY
jgi:cysteine desulfurase / selenocysteine lyase